MAKNSATRRADKDILTRTVALGLWEGLSHSASLRSIVIFLKCHSASLRLIVIVFKLVAAKNNWLVHSKLELERL